MKESTGIHRFRIQKRDRKKLTLFLGCAVFSVLLWLLFSLSKAYTYTIPATVEFSNIPEKRSLSLARKAAVVLKIEGTGWQLLTSRIKISKTDLSVDLDGHKIGSFISLSDFIPDFNLQLPPGQRLLDVKPDTIHFNYTGRSIKKIPLLVHYSVAFQKQFNYRDPLEISPDSVTISGPAAQLEKVTRWDSPYIKLTQLNHSVDTTISLLGGRYAGLIVKPDHIIFSVKVDQFTEDMVVSAVHISNNPTHALVTVVPSHVKIYFQVPLAYFYNVRPELFEVSADLDDWRLRHQNKLKLAVTRLPAFIRIEKIEPSSIDFLIKK